MTRMEAAGIRTAYASYWVAYKLDFVSRGGLDVTTAGFEFDRVPTIADRVADSADPAWIFVPLSEARRDHTPFTTPQATSMIDSETESDFLATLRNVRIPYRVLDFGIAQAVVPARGITPYEAGFPGAPA